jgi:hypothetical protein
LRRADVDSQRFAAQLLGDVYAGASHPAANIQQLPNAAGEACHCKDLLQREKRCGADMAGYKKPQALRGDIGLHFSGNLPPVATALLVRPATARIYLSGAAGRGRKKRGYMCAQANTLRPAAVMIFVSGARQVCGRQ